MMTPTPAGEPMSAEARIAREFAVEFDVDIRGKPTRIFGAVPANHAIRLMEAHAAAAVEAARVEWRKVLVQKVERGTAQFERAEAAEQQLAAARTLLERIKKDIQPNSFVNYRDISLYIDEALNKP